MEPVVLALVSNERYFPGLYSTVASALSHLDSTREVDLEVLDGGISKDSKNTLCRLVERYGKVVRLQFVAVDESLFRDATLGPAESHMAYCGILVPRLMNVPRVVYLDADTLIFRDLSELFDLKLPTDKALAAVTGSETLTLGEDSGTLANAMKLSGNKQGSVRQEHVRNRFPSTWRRESTCSTSACDREPVNFAGMLVY